MIFVLHKELLETHRAIRHLPNHTNTDANVFRKKKERREEKKRKKEREERKKKTQKNRKKEGEIEREQLFVNLFPSIYLK